MIWLNPAALIAIAVVAAPILVHILVQRRAERFAFPTLRFLRPTRLAAIRRHVLDDVLLLAVRVAILAAAVAALAGPLIVTGARRQMWRQRIARATVVETSTPAPVQRASAQDGARVFQGSDTAPSEQPFRSQTFATPSLSDGIRRAVAWLETAPPARRELAIVSPFAIGSITAADLARVPPDIGIRFERSGRLPPIRTIPFGRLLTAAGALDREVTLAGTATAVRDVLTSSRASDPSSFPIEILASPAARPAADAAVDAVLAQRVWTPAPDRRARLILLDAGAFPTDSEIAQTFRSAVSDVEPIRVPWMADAIARVARDADVQAAMQRVVWGLTEARFSTTRWQLVANAADGQPLVVAAKSGSRLIVVSAAPVSGIATPILVRAIANSLATIPDLRGAEVVPISDETLSQWSRPSSSRPVPRIRAVDQDDRRWFWLTALGLLAIETWIRRVRTRNASVEGDGRLSRRSARSAHRREAARVA